MRIRLTMAALAFAAVGLAWQPQAQAIGCLSGGLAGAVAGHMAHHGVLGAVGGCVAGHAYKKHQQRAATQSYQNETPRNYDNSGYPSGGDRLSNGSTQYR